MGKRAEGAPEKQEVAGLHVLQRYRLRIVKLFNVERGTPCDFRGVAVQRAKPASNSNKPSGR